MPKVIVTSQTLSKRRESLVAEQENIAARLRAAEAEMESASAELRDLMPARNSIVHAEPGVGKSHFLQKYTAKRDELEDFEHNARSLTLQYNSLAAEIGKVDEEIARGVQIEIPFREEAVGVTIVNAAGLARRHERAKRAEKRALAVLDRFSVLIPDATICSEEIGDAGEWMARRADAGWSSAWMYFKMLTTMFWLVVNTWRNKGKK
jgi:hypothetical protein